MHSLSQILADEIQRDGPITFARFMAVALYHPTLGYYAGGGAGREPVGWEGDYFTSGDLHPLWGASIARQLHQMWQLMGQPARFDVVEPGAGRGLLARDVWGWALRHAPDWASSLHYTLADRAPKDTPLRTARESRLAAELARLGAPEGAIHWADELSDALPHDGITGCVVSNELADALPAHIVEKREGVLREIYVDVDMAAGRFIERAGPPSTPEVATYLDEYHVPWRDYPDSWRAEVCLEARAWLRRIAAGIRRGFILTIDYGDTARRLYTRDRRRGTLAVYSQHQFGERPLAQPGTQDITAHVNFSALIQTGRESGWRLAGLTTQAAFLAALGLRDRIAALSGPLAPAAGDGSGAVDSQLAYLRRISQRNALSVLLSPTGLGGFKVLIQHRGVPGASRALLGLQPSPTVAAGG
ncbi:MAG TPA: SAM-dependent methyltransferase [Ktedonobacterales bacterium]|nr:SAM-dependent methyltransferase [Ktedonobacterales bacterium]